MSLAIRTISFAGESVTSQERSLSRKSCLQRRGQSACLRVKALLLQLLHGLHDHIAHAAIAQDGHITPLAHDLRHLQRLAVAILCLTCIAGSPCWAGSKPSVCTGPCSAHMTLCREAVRKMTSKHQRTHHLSWMPENAVTSKLQDTAALSASAAQRHFG